MTGAAVLIIGGRSRLAARLRAVAPAARAIVRRDPGPNDVMVADYDAIPAAEFAGMATVVNCVGTPNGDEDTLHRINVHVPIAAATAARAAGCRHFIQLSSLSVYGGAATIDAMTQVAPVSAYGRSKEAADSALLALTTPGFAMTILRVPALYGIGAAGKLGTLAQAMRKIGGFVVPRRPIARSLLHLDNAAAVIARLIEDADPRCGIALAADHRPFDFASFAAAVSADSGRPVRLVRAPGWFNTMLRFTAPRLYASTFADSLIAPTATITRDMTLPVDLPDGIAAMLAAEPRTR